VDGAADRVLDGKDAAARAAGLDRREHVFKGRTGQKQGVRSELRPRRLAVRARLALEAISMGDYGRGSRQKSNL
jgi:hypothetical protein